MTGPIAFRCYTGPGIGAGHLMRCREIARYLKSRGHRCIMMGPSENVRTQSDGILFDIWKEQSNPFDREKDSRQFIGLCADHSVRYAIMDDYRICPEYQQVLKSANLRWLQQFDASRPWDFWADVLVNSGPGENRADYQPYLKNRDTVLLFGPEFAVIRSEFCNVTPRPDGREIRSIFISFGGGDDHGLIARTVNHLYSSIGPDRRVAIVSGQANPGNRRYRDLYSGERFIDFHISPDNVAGLMIASDLAIIGGGTMSYEAAICGLPLVLIAVADNQQRACRGWREMIGARYLGKPADLAENEIRDAVDDLAADATKRKRMASLGRATVDGYGVSRLMDALIDE